MTISVSALSLRKANRVPVFAVMGFLLCTAQWNPPNIQNTASATPPPRFPKLERLSGKLILDGVGLTGDAIQGLVILNLDKAKISDEISARFVPLKEDVDFQKELCEQCKNPQSTFGAYVLLNTLYPDRRLNLVIGRITRTGDGMRDVPIKILSGNMVLRTEISREQFGVIIYEYWRHHFKIKSEAELIYEEMLRKAANEESQRQRKQK